MRRLVILLVLFVLAGPTASFGHGGGLDDLGCHHDRKRGGYHCHRGALSGRSFSSKSAALRVLEPPKTTRPTPAPRVSTTSRATVSTEEATIAVQNLLKKLGYDPGPADGGMGTATIAAIRAFQTAKGLPVDGRVSGRLLVRLTDAVLEE